MVMLLDALAVVAVIGALAFLFRGQRGCASCARRNAPTRIALDDLRAAARRASGRD